MAPPAIALARPIQRSASHFFSHRAELGAFDEDDIVVLGCEPFKHTLGNLQFAAHKFLARAVAL